MPRSFRRRLPLLGGSLGLIGALALGGCGQRSGGGGSSSLQGAGATFPAPLYQRWFQELAGQGGARVNYQSVGSGAGVRQFESGTVDFAASDKPLSAEEAAAIPGAGQTAWQCLNKGDIQTGQKILIYGASGAVGTYAVQLASRHFGAEVTGVCSAANLELVKSLGACRVMDYTEQGFSLCGETYDVVFDAVGKLAPAQGKKALKPSGAYINVHADSDGGDRLANLLLLKELVEAGKLNPAIDRVYPLEQIVEAHRYVEQGHKKGNVVITVGTTGKRQGEKK